MLAVYSLLGAVKDMLEDFKKTNQAPRVPDSLTWRRFFLSEFIMWTIFFTCWAVFELNVWMSLVIGGTVGAVVMFAGSLKG